MHTIRAAVLHRKSGPLQIESLELESPRDDEVLVRIVASGICRTDIDLCDDWDEADGPLVPGHEGAGVVEEVGRRVKGAKPGDRVVLSYQMPSAATPSSRGADQGLLTLDLETFWDGAGVITSSG